VHVTYIDSTTNFNQKNTANVDFYFANGIGLVEADVHSFEYLNSDIGGSGFKHTAGSGIVYRKN
jgi:hypothetical protein